MSQIPITRKQIVKSIEKGAKKVIAQSELYLSTRSGKKELDHVVKRLAAQPFSNLAVAVELGEQLGQEIVALSQQMGKQNLDQGVIRQLVRQNRLPEVSDLDASVKPEQPKMPKPSEPTALEAVVEPEMMDALVDTEAEESVDDELYNESIATESWVDDQDDADDEDEAVEDEELLEILEQPEVSDEAQAEYASSLAETLLEGDEDAEEVDADGLEETVQEGSLAAMAEAMMDEEDEDEEDLEEDLDEEDLDEEDLDEEDLDEEELDEEELDEEELEEESPVKAGK